MICLHCVYGVSCVIRNPTLSHRIVRTLRATTSHHCFKFNFKKSILYATEETTKTKKTMMG
jgi:hypothetical protein